MSALIAGRLSSAPHAELGRRERIHRQPDRPSKEDLRTIRVRRRTRAVSRYMRVFYPKPANLVLRCELLLRQAAFPALVRQLPGGVR